MKIEDKIREIITLENPIIEMYSCDSEETCYYDGVKSVYNHDDEYRIEYAISALLNPRYEDDLRELILGYLEDEAIELFKNKLKEMYCE